MKFVPFENWVTLEPAPDLHQDVPGFERPVHYSRRRAEPNLGRWFRVVEVGDGCPPYVGPEAPVLCNLTMLSDDIGLGDERLLLMPFRSVAGIRVGNATMAELGLLHPIAPIGDYVLCKDNDEKHLLLLSSTDRGRVERFFEGGPVPEMPAGKRLHVALTALERGQRTDEQYEKHVDDDGWESETTNRPNDGVKMMFSEVAEVGPEVPTGRLERGDMVAFRPNICGIRFELFGVSYRLIRCPEKNSEAMGKVPRAVFERMLGKAEAETAA